MPLLALGAARTNRVREECLEFARLQLLEGRHDLPRRWPGGITPEPAGSRYPGRSASHH